MKPVLASTTAVVLAAVAGYSALRWARQVHLPAHMQGHTVVYDPHLLSPEIADELHVLMKQLRDFPTNAADLNFYKTAHEHIGEAVPMVNGSCSHPYLVPNPARTHCILPGRIDVARGYVVSGGVEGLKEPHPMLVSRVQSFGRYHFNISEFGVVERLFSDPRFQSLAKAVCPPDSQELDAFQFNFITNLPGQTVASHIDAPYFFGADRFHVPQWLLAVMVFSGLWTDRFVHQVQVVAYIHRWEDPTGARRGQFVYYNDSTGVPHEIPPAALSGSSVDGSKVIHAATVYMPDATLPLLDKSKVNLLRYVGGEATELEGSRDTNTHAPTQPARAAETWELSANGAPVRTYNTSDLRFSVVYRARCFRDGAQRAAFAAQRREGGPAGSGDMLPLETILGTLKEDLVRRGRAGGRPRAALDALPPLDLAMLLMDEYTRYPLSHTAAVPFNYCALKLKLPPALGSLLDWVC